MSKQVADRIKQPGPKRILALDGGGIRGILSVQILQEIETLLRRRSGDPDLVLSDYFDLIGGTSTGAIIAAALSLGWPTNKLHELYYELGNAIFPSRFLKFGLMQAKFSAVPLRKALKAYFEDTTFGSSDIKTALGVVAKRLDTGSTWIVHNNPAGPYYGPGDGNAVPNKDFLLRNIVRASTAAPHYFEPESIRVARGASGAFVDGGISPHNNPALQLLMLATLNGHGYNWALGEDNLLLVSVGTGGQEMRLSASKVMKMKAMGLAVRSLASLMNDASALNEQVLQWMSRSPTARVIDSEVGDLDSDVLGGGTPWLSYARYDVWLHRDWLEDRLDLQYTQKALDSFAQMDNPDNLDELVAIGQRAGQRLVRAGHFPRVFDT